MISIHLSVFVSVSALAAAVSWPPAVQAAAIHSGIDEEAQLPYWEVADKGMSLRLIQRLPDQTRGFFQARGFSETDADLIAMNCVFQTVFKNISASTAKATLEYNLHEWVLHSGDRQGRMKTREDWRTEWDARKAPKSAQLAFEWALLPTRQTYRPGDFNWGMSVFGLKPGSRFDDDVVWHQYGEKHTVRVKDMECAPDIQPTPDAP